MKSFSSYIFEKFKITKKTVQNNHYIEDIVLKFLESELHYFKDEDFKFKAYDDERKENTRCINLDFSMSDYFDRDSDRQSLCDHIINHVEEICNEEEIENIKITGTAIAPYQVYLYVTMK